MTNTPQASPVPPCAGLAGTSSIEENRAGVTGQQPSPGATCYAVLIGEQGHNGGRVCFNNAAGHETLDEAFAEAHALQKYSDIRILAILQIDRVSGRTFSLFNEASLKEKLAELYAEEERARTVAQKRVADDFAGRL